MSGDLPLATYHRTNSLGSGSYGSVFTVFDDDGNEFALKLFDEDDDCLPLGALREVSILRLFRHENEHPNIIGIHDVQSGFQDEEDGAGTNGYLSMAMPLFDHGSLMDALKSHKLTSRAQKVTIAHGILEAVAHLHDHSIIHRDIKSDNILLGDSEGDMFRPVLIDFSLAKVMDPTVMIPCKGKEMWITQAETGSTHTPSIGTPTYRSPEVIEQRDYSFPSDMWSVGVVLLELLLGKELEALKDKSALSLIHDALHSLPQDQPFPRLVQRLLEVDPERRLTAREALQSDLFQKFGLPRAKPIQKLILHDALPLECPMSEKENTPTKNGKKVDPTRKRFQRIQKICRAMEWDNPLTGQAALSYSMQMSELCDVDDLDDPQALLDCVVLAHRFFERHLTDLEELCTFPMFEEWDMETYQDNEGTLFLMMDFCLYPRQFFVQ